MTKQSALRIVRKIISENRENGELEGTLNRGRIAALNHLLASAEPEYCAKRVGRRLIIYRRDDSPKDKAPK